MSASFDPSKHPRGQQGRFEVARLDEADVDLTGYVAPASFRDHVPPRNPDGTRDFGPYRLSFEEDEAWDDDEPVDVWLTVTDTRTDESVGQVRYVDRGDRVALNTNIDVDSKYRGQGIASVMMRVLADETGKPVDPTEFTEDGLGLWRHLGWDAYGR